MGTRRNNQFAVFNNVTRKQFFGLSPEVEATFMYCGSYANQQALYMALPRKAEQREFDLAEKRIRTYSDIWGIF